MAKVRCQRLGCEAAFSEDDNPDGSCTYHDAGPLFHDGMKEWSCCKKRSHDFNLFLQIPGCKTGKHTTEKPVLPKAAAAPRQPVSAPTATTNLSGKDACPRCRQGFFCSDHGQTKEINPKLVASANIGSTSDIQEPKPPEPNRFVDINQPQICKNKGCGMQLPSWPGCLPRQNERVEML